MSKGRWRGFPRWFRFAAGLLLICLMFTELAGVYPALVAREVDAQPYSPAWMFDMIGRASPFVFMASLTATMAVFIEHFFETRDWLRNQIFGFDVRVSKVRDEILEQFITQTRLGARLVDVAQEPQIESLYRDASQICAYFPVHTLLKESSRLRTVLAETMHHDTFRTYDMVVGELGEKRLIETFDAWCDCISELKKHGDRDSSIRERNNLITFLKNIRVRRCLDPKEDEVRLSFFHVTLSDGIKRRGVIYIWADPFGFYFDRVNGALILDGDSGYLIGLSKIFSEAWGQGEDITQGLLKHVQERMKWKRWPQIEDLEPSAYEGQPIDAAAE